MTLTAFAQTGEISLGLTDNGVNLYGGVLSPGEQYLFPIKISVDGSFPVELTPQQCEGKSLVVTYSKGQNAIAETSVKEISGRFYLSVTPKVSVPSANAALTLSLRDDKSGETESSATANFSVAFGGIMADSKLDGLTAGESLVIDKSSPVITPSQTAKLFEINSGAYTVSGDGWSLALSSPVKNNINMFWSDSPIPDVARAFGKNNLKFISFTGSPNLGQSGRVSVDVSYEMADFGENFYLYRYLDGVLYNYDSQLNKEDATLNFNAEKLGCYVISDKKITDSYINVAASPGSSSSSVPSSGDASSPSNPSTGSSSPNYAVSVFSALAALSAAALSVSKRKK